MFDPTIFDNLKTGIENYIYDMDNITGQVRVTDRIDRLELATMSRWFMLQFELADRPGAAAEVVLEAGLSDLADEILERQGSVPGCKIAVRFVLCIQDAASQCQAVQEIIHRIWQPELEPVQTLQFTYGEDAVVYKNTVELRFKQKIDEDNMEDLPELAEHMLLTLQELVLL